MNRQASALLRELKTSRKINWLKIEGFEGLVAADRKSKIHASDLARRCLDAVDFPRGPIVPAEQLNEEQREVAEELAVRAGVYSSKHALPQKAWVRRRWLGLAAGGALEKRVSFQHEGKRVRKPLWQALSVRSAGTAGMTRPLASPAELAKGMSLTKRLEVYGDLQHEPYGFAAGSRSYESWVSLDEIGSSGKAWARRTADRWVMLWSHEALSTERGWFSSDFRLLLCLTLARTGARIRPEWDFLVPVLKRLPGSKLATPAHEASKECLRALPEDRRNAVLARAIASGADPIDVGTKMIRAFPSEELARALLERLVEVRRPPSSAMKALRGAARRNAGAATALDEYEERRGRVRRKR